MAPVPRSVHSELCALQARLRPAKPGPGKCILGAHRFSVKKTALPGGQSYETLQSRNNAQFEVVVVVCVCGWAWGAHKKGDCLPSSRDVWEGSIGNAALWEPARKCLPGTQRAWI